MGGTVNVDSVEGEGTTFTINLLTKAQMNNSLNTNNSKSIGLASAGRYRNDSISRGSSGNSQIKQHWDHQESPVNQIQKDKE